MLHCVFLYFCLFSPIYKTYVIIYLLIFIHYEEVIIVSNDFCFSGIKRYHEPLCATATATAEFPTDRVHLFSLITNSSPQSISYLFNRPTDRPTDQLTDLPTDRPTVVCDLTHFPAFFQNTMTDRNTESNWLLGKKFLKIRVEKKCICKFLYLYSLYLLRMTK